MTLNQQNAQTSKDEFVHFVGESVINNARNEKHKFQLQNTSFGLISSIFKTVEMAYTLTVRTY
jgi:hypothetical protein